MAGSVEYNFYDAYIKAFLEICKSDCKGEYPYEKDIREELTAAYRQYREMHRRGRMGNVKALADAGYDYGNIKPGKISSAISAMFLALVTDYLKTYEASPNDNITVSKRESDGAVTITVGIPGEEPALNIKSSRDNHSFLLGRIYCDQDASTNLPIKTRIFLSWLKSMGLIDDYLTFFRAKYLPDCEKLSEEGVFNRITLETAASVTDILFPDASNIVAKWESRHECSSSRVYGYQLENICEAFSASVEGISLSSLMNMPELAVSDNAQKDDISNLFNRTAERIKGAVDTQPFMQSLYDKIVEHPEYRDEYRNIVKSIVSFHEGDIVVQMPIRTLEKKVRLYIYEAATQYHIMESELIAWMGGCAESAKSNEKHIISDEAFKALRFYSGEVEINELKFGWISRGDGQGRKFKVRQYRLIFSALRHAALLNEQLKSIIASGERSFGKLSDTALDHIYSYAPEGTNALNGASSANGQNDHLGWNIDGIIVYSCVLLNNVHGEIYKAVVDALIKQTKDFAVSCRMKHEIALYILCYLLCEDSSVKDCQNPYLSEEKKKEIFLTAYGKSIYPFQIYMWKYLKTKSTEYERIVEDTLGRAVEYEDGFAKESPYFVFLGGVGSDENDIKACGKQSAEDFLKRACMIEGYVWDRLNNVMQSNIANVSDYISMGLIAFVQRMNNNRTTHNNVGIHGNLLRPGDLLRLDDLLRPDDLLRHVYGCNMLLYALADVARAKGLNEALQQAGLKSTTLNRAIMLCDYYNRKTNRCYNALYSDRKDYPYTEEDLFLLCGPYRVNSHRVFSLYISESAKIKLTDAQLADYKVWYGNERGRYKVLLSRLLLLCSDFFDKAGNEIVITEEDLSGGFLLYDSISVEELRKAIKSNDQSLMQAALKSFA